MEVVKHVKSFGLSLNLEPERLVLRLAALSDETHAAEVAAASARALGSLKKANLSSARSLGAFVLRGLKVRLDRGFITAAAALP